MSAPRRPWPRSRGSSAGGALAAVGVDGPLRPDLDADARIGEHASAGCSARPFTCAASRAPPPHPWGSGSTPRPPAWPCALAAAHPAARIAEAFPTAFLRTLLAEHAVGRVRRGDKSQVYWARCVAAGVLDRLVGDLYGEAAAPIAAALTRLTQRDERAAAVCALTARAAALGADTRVGDAEDGWISLPPRRFLAEWARAAL